MACAARATSFGVAFGKPVLRDPDGRQLQQLSSKILAAADVDCADIERPRLFACRLDEIGHALKRRACVHAEQEIEMAHRRDRRKILHGIERC